MTRTLRTTVAILGALLQLLLVASAAGADPLTLREVPPTPVIQGTPDAGDALQAAQGTVDAVLGTVGNCPGCTDFFGPSIISCWIEFYDSQSQGRDSTGRVFSYGSLLGSCDGDTYFPSKDPNPALTMDLDGVAFYCQDSCAGYNPDARKACDFRYAFGPALPCHVLDDVHVSDVDIGEDDTPHCAPFDPNPACYADLVAESYHWNLGGLYSGGCDADCYPAGEVVTIGTFTVGVKETKGWVLLDNDCSWVGPCATDTCQRSAHDGYLYLSCTVLKVDHVDGYTPPAQPQPQPDPTQGPRQTARRACDDAHGPVCPT